MLSPDEKFKQSLKLIDACYQYLPKDIDIFINSKKSKIAVVCTFEYALNEKLIQSKYTFLRKEQIEKFLDGSNVKFEDVQSLLNKEVVLPAVSLSDKPKKFWELLSDINTWFFK